MKKYYAQLDEDNVCIGVSELSGEVLEYNFAELVEYNPITKETTTTEQFISRMIEIPVYSTNYLGLRYLENDNWEEALEPEPEEVIPENSEEIPDDVLDEEELALLEGE